jgi:hypothetical protein
MASQERMTVQHRPAPLNAARLRLRYAREGVHRFLTPEQVAGFVEQIRSPDSLKSEIIRAKQALRKCGLNEHGKNRFPERQSSKTCPLCEIPYAPESLAFGRCQVCGSDLNI